MRKRSISSVAGILAAAAAATTTSAVRAQLVYEPFDYGSAANATTYTNQGGPLFQGFTNPSNGLSWFDGGTTGPALKPILNTAGDLSISGLAASSGGMHDSGGSTQSETVARIGIGTPVSVTTGNNYTAASNTIYYSLAFQLTDLTGLTTTGDALGGFNNSQGTQTNLPSVYGTRLQLRLDPDQVNNAGKFNVGVSGTGTAAIWDTTDKFSINTPIFVVGAYAIGAGGINTGNDVQSLWINPQATPANMGAASAPAPTVTAAPLGQVNTGINTF